ncbi:MAG: formylglycine-generating enzyme family protein, partial [Candidatus Electrothrix sp. ATG2]|nr:formylglycine-generating enzyme family protein [Candidatus Electrothrix sp. ATG2]
CWCVGLWVEIPAVKEFIMGSNDKDARDNEKPVHPVDVETFSISRYLITNAQFRCFIEAGGYEDIKYWQTKAGRDWLNKNTDQHAPEYWHDRKWNNPNHPVVGVSWFEALAFCAWLTEVTGKPVRLPGEEEWEYAARGKEGLKYAWGDDFSAELGNTRKTKLERTSTVGLFPSGAAFNLYDMTGNVWEWTANRWGKDFEKTDFSYADWQRQNREERERLDVNELRVIRGGSWYYYPNLARCSIRNRNNPNNRNNNIGFRVVFSIASDG